MGEKVKNTGNELRRRWLARMPRFFHRLMIICTCIVATAISINTMLQIAGATPHQWWNDIYPLLIGIPSGMAIVCKLTVDEGYKDIDPDKLIESNPMLKKHEETEEKGNDNTNEKQ